ncbi:hypothetical protein CHS0354_032537 [Potamilus streckersoni]|uniref:lysoplasmalogenase n=1 Tax=Potamilus streckersoni TaxID=2493646 RepID=A0AAE0SQN9_9BIVA|nr:hypothetical protein CHS0354_032537 [Potamilus streckersoni]
MKTMSVKLTLNEKLRLAPFIFFSLFYFLNYEIYKQNPPENLFAAIFKMLPVLSLALYVAITNSMSPDHLTGGIKSLKDLIPEEHLPCFVMVGLMISSLGDACLIWRQSLFVLGVLFFAFAQCLYIVAFSGFPGTRSTKELFILVGMNAYMCVQSGMTSYGMKVLVMFYMCVLFTMGWRATARFEVKQTIGALIGCIGAISFMCSDFLIAVNMWVFPVPLCEFLVMVSYYGAQLGIALSTTPGLDVKTDL